MIVVANSFQHCWCSFAQSEPKLVRFRPHTIQRSVPKDPEPISRMAKFDMDEFNEILEKCRDQSLQKEQDAVWIKRCCYQLWIVPLILATLIHFRMFLFRYCWNRSPTFSKFRVSSSGPRWHWPSITGWTFRRRSWRPSARWFRWCTIPACCKYKGPNKDIQTLWGLPLKFLTVSDAIKGNTKVMFGLWAQHVV